MTTSTKNHSDFFYRALVAEAMIGPMPLVIAAGAMPESRRRANLSCTATEYFWPYLRRALVLRAAYARGFSRPLKIAASAPNDSVTA